MLDDSVMQWIAAHRVGALTWVAQRAAALSARRPLAVITLVGTVALVLAGKVRVVITAGAAAAAALLVTVVLKGLVERPRPPGRLAAVTAYGWSMPSTDSAVVAALLITVALTWPALTRSGRRWLVGAAVAVAVLIGLLTAYVGAHWLTDVLAGLAIGAVLAVGAERIGRRIRPGRAASG